MAMAADTIDHTTLERLIEAGAVRGACIVGQPGGWSVVIQYGMTERALAAKRIVLGAAVLGQPVEGRLEAALSLIGGEGQGRLVLTRSA